MKITSFACFLKKPQHLSSSGSGSTISLAYLGTSMCGLVSHSFHSLVYTINPFWIQLCYFSSFSFFGLLILSLLETRPGSIRPKALDMYFMSVSATTVSSMSTVEMEVFSDAQLVVFTILMFLGGEVFVSILGLQFSKYKIKRSLLHNNKVNNDHNKNDVYVKENNVQKLSCLSYKNVINNDHLVMINNVQTHESSLIDSCNHLKYNSIRYLGYITFGYLVVIIGLGSTLVAIYISLVPSASEVLYNKGLRLRTFSVFTIVSTFTNCGFIPTNENMIVFRKNSGLLLLLVPQILLGNTLYPTCLRLVIWVLGRFTRRVEYNYMLKYSEELGYAHFLPRLHSLFLFFTVLGFIVVQFTLFCLMEWNSEVLSDGLNSFQKIIAALFEVVNSRHTGESIVDLSTISSAILVLFVIMMYLPPYTSFLPIKDYEEKELKKSGDEKMINKKKRGGGVQNLLFSQLSYLAIFVVLICITERQKMKDDPLNFTVLNVVIEVISAYGNVGFTTGYSCKRQLIHESNCKDTWYGFSGQWSNTGKFILILVMFFGRLKKFNMQGGASWYLS
ncbi:hypothetical protein Sjap_023046 [Stephania japonica]|uniref:Uncharacterized protein n=1 Tax=Stephania japonica TaxID=461633 RepID=A0AAP0EQH9_9MAGN